MTSPPVSVSRSAVADGQQGCGGAGGLDGDGVDDVDHDERSVGGQLDVERPGGQITDIFRTLTLSGLYIPDLDTPANSAVAGFLLLPALPAPGGRRSDHADRIGTFAPRAVTSPEGRCRG